MAELQSTNRTKLSMVRESTFGVTPANPAWKTQRPTSSSLAMNPQTVVTAEIREDRQVTDLILVGQDAQGDIGAELGFRKNDDHLEELLQGTWSTYPRILVATEDVEISDVSATTLTVASALGTPFKAGHLVLTEGFNTAGNNKLARVSSSSATTIVFPASTFTAEAAVPVGASARVIGFEGVAADIVATTTGGNALTSTALDFTTIGLAVGDWVKIGSSVTDTGFATAANNGWARISAIAANRLSFDVVPTGWAADAGTGKTIRVFVGERLRNGSTERSNSIERQYLDHSPVTYEYFTGMTLSKATLEFASRAVIKMTMTYMGQSGSVTTTRVSGSTDVAAPTNDILNTSTNVADVSFDGATVTGPNFIMGASIVVDNNMRMQEAVSSVGAVGIGNGEFNVSGSLNVYFGSPAILQKVLDNARTSLSLRAGRQDGNRETLLMDLPSIKMSGGSPSVSGKNQDVMLDATFQALMHQTLLYTIALQRFWYMPA